MLFFLDETILIVFFPISAAGTIATVSIPTTTFGHQEVTYDVVLMRFLFRYLTTVSLDYFVITASLVGRMKSQEYIKISLLPERKTEKQAANNRRASGTASLKKSNAFGCGAALRRRLNRFLCPQSIDYETRRTDV